MESDLEFLQISCFLYKFRMNNKVQDILIEDLSRWLQSKGKLNTRVGFDKPVVITSASPNFSKILDVVNIYSPNFPMLISIKSEKNKSVRKLDFKSDSTVIYQGKSLVTIPCFHGGEIVVNGQVDGLDIYELVKVSNPSLVFKTSNEAEFIVVDQERVTKILDELCAIIERSEDEDLFQFSLKARIVAGGIQIPDSAFFLRIWKIHTYFDDGFFFLRADKNSHTF